MELDKSVAPAGALQIAQDVARQDFEAIGAKVYYSPLMPLPEEMKNAPANPLAIADVAKDWRAEVLYAYEEHIMVITHSDFKTQGQLAPAIEEAMPKARHIKRSWKDIMRPLRLEEKAYAVELRPEEAAHFQIAEILVEEGKYTEAVNELEEIMKSTANEEVKNLVRARISTIYAKMGLDEKSEGELKKIVETTSNLELKKRALMTLANIYRSQKRYDEAVAILRQVIELTQPDVMKLLQFRKEFMPPGFTFAAVRPDWPIRENPAWLTPEALNEVAESYDLRILPKRGYVCFFDKNGKATDDLLYALLEFGDEKTAAAAAAGISAEFREDQPEGYFGAAFAASNVVVMVSAEKAEYIPAANWLGITLLNALPDHLQIEAKAKLQAASFREAQARAEVHQKAAACKAELRAIGIALQAYAEDYDGYFPDNLETLIAKHYVKPAAGRVAFSCPAKPKGAAPGYIYIPGLNTRMMSRVLLLHDKPGNHPGGVNALFVDGHTEWIDLGTTPKATWKRLQRSLEEKRWGVAALCFVPSPLESEIVEWRETFRRAGQTNAEADVAKAERDAREFRWVGIGPSEIREGRALLKLLIPKEEKTAFAAMTLRGGIWQIEFLIDENELDEARKWLGVEESGGKKEGIRTAPPPAKTPSGTPTRP